MFFQHQTCACWKRKTRTFHYNQTVYFIQFINRAVQNRVMRGPSHHPYNRTAGFPRSHKNRNCIRSRNASDNSKTGNTGGAVFSVMVGIASLFGPSGSVTFQQSLNGEGRSIRRHKGFSFECGDVIVLRRAWSWLWDTMGLNEFLNTWRMFQTSRANNVRSYRPDWSLDWS